MNEPAAVTERDDGYVQDRGSQLVTEAVGAAAGERRGRPVRGARRQGHRPGRRRSPRRGPRSAARPGPGSSPRTRAASASPVGVAVADGRRPPVRTASADRVLVDAPCSGLGALRRRPDARWRIDAAAVDRLADAASVSSWTARPTLVAPGGTLVLLGLHADPGRVDRRGRPLRRDAPGLRAARAAGRPWVPWGSGSLLLPQAEGTDGMAVFRWSAGRRRSGCEASGASPARPSNDLRRGRDGAR